MNLDKLMTIQAELDKHIEVKKGLQGQGLLDKKILALQVELGELANEWRGFKFWSSDQRPRGYNLYTEGNGVEQKNPLLEEYVDCLHFILSIGLEMKLTNTDISKRKRLSNRNITRIFSDLMLAAGTLIYPEADKPNNYGSLLHGFIYLGEKLGFTTKQIEQAYLDKNKVNHARQESGY